MQYKVITTKVKKAEALMNQYASEGWEVLTTIPNNGIGFGMVITFVKK